MQILFQFDVRTVALFIALTFFVQATAIGAQAYMIRDLSQYRGIGAALAANLCLAAGLMLRLFADRLPDFLTTIPANLLILSGPAFFYIALGQFTGLGDGRWLVGSVLMAALVSLLYFTYWQDDIGLRTVTLSAGIAVMILLLVYQLLRTRRTALQFSADIMLVSFLTYGFFMIGRTIAIALNPPQEPFSDTPVQAATYLLTYIISFFWSTGFILMVSQRLRNDLMEIATVDVLTHIPNRRATQAFLERELSRAQREADEFTVLLIDIDNFKQVNDRWGHAAGDEVLVQTAALFQSLIRKQDWVGRWGGEEFLVILSGDCDAAVLAERLRSEIAAFEFTHGGASFGITVSIGIACGRPASQLDQVLRDADRAMYRAKRTRNAVSAAN